MNRRSTILLPGAAMLVSSAAALRLTPSAEAQSTSSTLCQQGPSGGVGGSAFFDAPIPRRVRLQQMVVRAGLVIDAIQITYIRWEGGLLPFPQHGGNGGSLNVVNFFPNERIQAISGKYGTFGGPVVVLGLAVHTNFRSLSFGVLSAGSDFLYKRTTGNEIIAFHGRSGVLLDAIGIYQRPING